MKKLIRDDQVAVLVSPGHGAGWYSWHGIEELLYDPAVVDMVESGEDTDAVVRYCETTYGDTAYYGGVDQLTVEWVPVGTRFYIAEYDGAEHLVTEESMEQTWITA